MSAYIYIEGGGDDSKETHVRLREGFAKLLRRAGFGGRMPRTVACGGRQQTYDAFKTAFAGVSEASFVAMLVDSEDPMADIEATWEHLAHRPGDEGMTKPDGATNDQVLMMTTCMETWIVTDRTTVQRHYGGDLQENALPALHAMESRGRHAVQDALMHATRRCKNAYTKGKRSFDLLGELEPRTLRTHLPSYVRVERILNAKL